MLGLEHGAHAAASHQRVYFVLADEFGQLRHGRLLLVAGRRGAGGAYFAHVELGVQVPIGHGPGDDVAVGIVYLQMIAFGALAVQARYGAVPAYEARPLELGQEAG